MNHRLSDWIGSSVRASDGEVGKVEQLYFDDLTWSLRYLAVNRGDGGPDGLALISMEALGIPDWKNRSIPVNLTVEQVRNSPKTDAEKSVSRQHEEELRKHYSWPFYLEGGFYVPSEYVPAMAFFADSAPEEETPSSSVRKIDPHLHSSGEVIDFRVHATDGKIGHVEDFVVDDETWTIRYFIVNTRRWLSNRRVPVSPQWIKAISWDDGKVFVDLSRDAVKGIPAFDPEKPVKPDYESKLSNHVQKPANSEWVVFKIHAPPESKVYVAGTFNNWDATSIKLGDKGKGVYTATVLLPFGRYEYKFTVNGEWVNGTDTSEQAPNLHGTTNNVVVVGRAATQKSHLHTFARQPHHEAEPLWRTPTAG